MNGTCKGAIFGVPAHWGPGALGRAKGSNIIKFQLQSQFQIFLNQIFVFVFSQMKDIKHIRQSPGSCFGCWESKIKISEHSHVAYQIKKGRSVDQDTLDNFNLESNW